MFSMKNIPQLVRYAFCVANLNIYIIVGVSIYPVIDATVLDVILQFHHECTVGMAADKLRTLHLEGGWNMVAHNNLTAGSTG